MRAITLILLFLPALFGQSTGSIAGKATLEQTSDPLHHVSVLLVPTGRTTQTKEDGTFRFDNLPAGKYELVAHLHSLTDTRKTVEVVAGATATVDFQLKLETVRQQVTVTASGKEETTLETFLSATSLDSTDLASQSSTSLGDVLENQAGIAKRSSGPGTSRPVIRGFDGDRVLIMQDGIRTGTLSSQSGDHGEPIDPNSVERVEIVRGPSTLLYEGNAIGGVVNVISGHHQIHREAHDGLRGFLTAVGGSNNARRGSSGGFEYGLGHWLLTGDAGALYTSDYHTPLGTVNNSQSNIRNGSIGIARYTNKTFLNFSYGLQDGVYGVPSPDEQVTIPYRRHNVRFNGGYKNIGSFVDLFQLSLNYSDWKHQEKDGPDIANRFFNKQFVYRGVFEQKQRGRLGGSFGFWGLTRDYKAVGDEAITPPTQQNAFAVFGVEHLNFERFRLQFGARVERNKYNPEELKSRTFNGVAASIGANVPLWTGGAFIANFASSFRSPALEELYANGPHAGNLTFEIGNSTLNRERGNGIDLSLRHTSTRVRAEANYFYYRMSNFVFLAPTGEIEDAFPVAEYKQGSSRYRGFEARLSNGIGNHVWLHYGVDAVNAELRNPALPLPRIPPVRGRFGVEARAKGFSIFPELILTNKQDRVYKLEDPTAGYAVMNLKALYSITSKHLLHSFGFNLFNASDRLYRNHLSFIKGFAPEMGRGVFFTYTVRFF